MFLFLLCVCFFFFWGEGLSRFLIGCLRTHSADLASLEIRNLPASALSIGVKGVCHYYLVFLFGLVFGDLSPTYIALDSLTFSKKPGLVSNLR